ncbi:hypothetical protein COV19_00370 [Candidatus Woesearchaeota archaeon CG10_big_fil_rev_8_21_14_0_10_44_13]|nr:MAG: hypothetical protein COV19_00370 [Candidatus Woesearchaeota archaeon CG10_big_fil_rev_8_21_14_0_10_44_13]
MYETEDLYTYVDYICHIDTPRYKGLKIVPSISAMRDLMKHGKTLADAAEILENGHDAPRKRKKGVIERWADSGKKTFNAVAAMDYNEQAKEEVWVLVHFGKFTRKK